MFSVEARAVGRFGVVILESHELFRGRGRSLPSLGAANVPPPPLEIASVETWKWPIWGIKSSVLGLNSFLATWSVPPSAFFSFHASSVLPCSLLSLLVSILAAHVMCCPHPDNLHRFRALGANLALSLRLERVRDGYHKRLRLAVRYKMGRLA